MTQDDIKALIQKQFDRSSGISITFMHVCVKDEAGLIYGSYKRVWEDQLEGRDIEYTLWNGKPGVMILDSLFDPRTWKWTNPLVRNNHA